jgi:Arc/MetJ-type ribon-helix-helix transcriptional regulator
MRRFADPVTSLCAYCDGNVERLGLVRERAYQTQSSRIRFEIRLLTKDEGSKWCREGREYVRSVASVVKAGAETVGFGRSDGESRARGH